MRRIARKSIWLTAVPFVLLASAGCSQEQRDDEGEVGRLGQLVQARKFDEATRMAEEALQTVERRWLRRDTAVAQRLDNLATIYRIQRRYADAEPLLRRALTLREKALGHDNPGVCRSLSNLVVLYEMQGRYSDMEPLLKRALAIRERTLGGNHPSVGHSLHELAKLYTKQGRIAESEPLYDRALTILGPGHPEEVMRTIKAGDFNRAARLMGIRADMPSISTSVRQTFFGQVTELRWKGLRMDSGPHPQTMTLEGEAVHGNSIWQPFEVEMFLTNGQWWMRQIRALRGAWVAPVEE
jgi:tetratricopeptide (TPR) repeat protein